MRLRPYIQESDFDAIKNWITDERTHVMWCADRFSFPLEKENFNSVIREHFQNHGDIPFAATDDKGRVIGFFCYSVNYDTNEGMLKFVMIDPSQRGKGYGTEMMRLAALYAFEITKAVTLRLMVFAENKRAVGCYEKAGFALVSTDPGAFRYKDEAWSRNCMVIKKS